MLIYQNQDCDLTLREGIKVYEDYLVSNGKIPLKEPNDESTLISCLLYTSPSPRDRH